MAVCFSQDQWSDLDPTQKEFYGEYVLEEDCGIVVSLCKECFLSDLSVILWEMGWDVALRGCVLDISSDIEEITYEYEFFQVKGKSSA